MLAHDSTPPDPAAEIERRVRWPAPALLAFVGILVTLLVMAALPWIAPPRVLEGMPEDPGVHGAAARLRGLDPVPGSELAFASALFSSEAVATREAAATRGAARTGAVAGARAALEAAHRQRGGDPRLRVFLAHLDLADAADAALAGDSVRAMILLRRAEAAYRQVAGGRTEVPESRLGLGTLLAFRAERESDPERRRGLRLMAIAQFAAVYPRDRIYPAALYDRALMLAATGRWREARRCAAELIGRRDAGALAGQLPEAIARSGR